MSESDTRGTLAVVGDAMRDIKAAEEDLRTAQDAAWRRYVERVDAILAFDFELESDDDDHDPSHLLDGLRARVGELRLQAHLGAMEGEDLIERVRAASRRLTT